MTDFSHLHELEERAKRTQSQMLRVQKNDAEWNQLAIQLFQTEQEIADERQFLGLKDMSTDELYAEVFDDHESEVAMQITEQAKEPLTDEIVNKELSSLKFALAERSRLDPDAPTTIVFKESSEATPNTMKDFDLTPDWTQIYLNGGPPCFAVMGDDKRFCNRAEWWEGHPSDHKFVSWTDFLFEVMMWGYSAHESAIRTVAAALVEASKLDIDRIEQSWAYYQSIRTTAQPTIKLAKAKRSASLGFLANQIPKLVAEIRETRNKLADLKAALEQPEGL